VDLTRRLIDLAILAYFSPSSLLFIKPHPSLKAVEGFGRSFEGSSLLFIHGGRGIIRFVGGQPARETHWRWGKSWMAGGTSMRVSDRIEEAERHAADYIPTQPILRKVVKSERG
jgi:hypothetical protein